MTASRITILGILFALASGFAAPCAQAQMIDPVDWEFAAETTEEGTTLLIFKAAIDEGWKIYGQNIDDGGPVPTGIYFDDSAAFEFVGDWKALGKKKSGFDPFFEMDVEAFEKRVIFRREITVDRIATIKGFVEYMACDDKQCLAPTTEDFSLAVKPAKGPDVIDDDGSGMLEPVQWEFESEPIGGGEYVVRARAKVDDGWKIYSMDIPEADVRPEPTELVLENLPEGAELIGSASESGDGHEAREPLFDNLVIRYFKKEAVFEQRVRASATDTIGGYVWFMACDNAKCLAPKGVDFAMDLATGRNVFTADAIGDCNDLDIATIDNQPESSEKKGYLWIFLLGLGGGLIALLTPCVFPMIPMTVTFFTKGSGDRAVGIRNAVTYGLSIVLIYGLCGVPFAAKLVSGDVLNEIATNAWINLAFAAIFIVFAISFFGFFELTLPSRWSNQADSASQKGGLVGIFFMALTLALVSFSCTGPILGTFMIGTLQGDSDPMNVLFVMLGFGVGLGLPFGLFALFPAWLKTLPKSGGWLDDVKKVLGFLELGLAIKFISNADLVKQWGLIYRETFLVIWVLVALAIVLFLVGWVKLPHTSPVRKFGAARIAFIVLFAAMGVYFASGIGGRNLTAISGFPPPMFYSFQYKTQHHDDEPTEVFWEDVIYMVDGDLITVRDSGERITDPNAIEGILDAKEDQSHCPLGIDCFHDYETGLAYARLTKRPMMIDFTGWACVNCRRMEENVWVEGEVLDMLTEDYVLVSLYVDEKAELPASEQFTSCRFKDRVRTVGNKWSNLQQVNFNINAQPYYALVTPEEQLLTQPVGYTARRAYISWLQEGLQKFEKGEVLASR